MKIAVFTDVFPPLLNGAVIHIMNVITTMALAGHEIIVFTPKPKTPTKRLKFPKNVKIYYLSSISALIYPDFRLTFPFSAHALNVTRSFKPDIVHFHSPSTVGYNGITIAKLLNIPIVGTFHTYFMEPEYLRMIGLHKIKLDTNKTIVKLGWIFSNMFYNAADIVVCPSQTTKDDLMRNGLKRPVEVISSGIDVGLLLHKKRIKYHFSLPDKYFLYTGRLSPEKSVEILVRAFKIFSDLNKDIDLVLVGDGPSRKEIEELIEKLYLKKRVHITGMIPNEKLLQSNILPNALAYVIASKSETQCISVLEALSHGVKVIAVNARALPEVIEKEGILCKPDDIEEIAAAMKQQSLKRNRKNKVNEHFYKKLEEHSLANTIHKLEAIYQILIDNKDASYKNQEN